MADRPAARAAAALAGLLAALALSGCPRRHLVKGPGDPEAGVRVVWYGHSCFSFEDSVGRLFLVDPFDETVGYDLPWVDPDAVLVTHDHFDHNFLRRAVTFDLLEATGTHTLDGVEVTGLPADHDAEGGLRHGADRIYVWEMAGVRFAHAGDLGRPALTDGQREALRGVDVLFLPVGGRTTLDGPQAAALAREINPRVVVPMHYGNPRVRFFEFEPVDGFVKSFDDVFELPDADFQIRRADLPAALTVYLPALPDGKKP